MRLALGVPGELKTAGAVTAPPTVFAAELSAAALDALPRLIGDQRFDEEHAHWLLARKDLAGALLERIAQQREFPHSYRVLRAVIFHPNVPRAVVKPLVKNLHLMDVVKLSYAVSAAPDLRRNAEDQLIACIPHLPLGQKVAVARQGTARVLAALMSEGNPRVVGPALANARLTEAQVLKLLTNEKLPAAVVHAIARHSRWPALPNVRMALLRHPQTPYEIALRLLPHVTVGDLHSLAKLKTISAEFRRQIERAAAQR
jgi:hypothetical protein